MHCVNEVSQRLNQHEIFIQANKWDFHTKLMIQFKDYSTWNIYQKQRSQANDYVS